MIEAGDKLIPLRDVPALTWLPSRRRNKRLGQGRLGFGTLWRWATAGVRGVKLETVKVGGCMCTTERALIEFFRACAIANDEPSRAVRTPGQRERSHQRAEKQVEAVGI